MEDLKTAKIGPEVVQEKLTTSPTSKNVSNVEAALCHPIKIQCDYSGCTTIGD